MEDSRGNLEGLVFDSSLTINGAIRALDLNGTGILLIVNSDNVLTGTVTDGDIRRGLLKGLNLDAHVRDIENRDFLVVTPDIDKQQVLSLMHVNKVKQIPVVDNRGKVLAIHLWDGLGSSGVRENPFVIMAGGMGSRLYPKTENCPKPMIPVAGKPMLQHILERAREQGFRNFVISINHLGHMVESYFEDGQRFGVRIEYLREPKPLGTAGSLAYFKNKENLDVIITNGDVITDINYGDFLDFHIRQNAVATVAIKQSRWQNPFGVVTLSGNEIISYIEKPVTESYINAGIYALNPSSFSFLPQGERADMPDLLEKIRMEGNKSLGYLLHESWADVGIPEELQALDRSLRSKNGNN
jgi:dTDP-glucose pyrophosphorylase